MNKFKKKFFSKILAVILISCSVLFSAFIGTSFNNVKASFGYWKDVSLAANYKLNDADGDGYLDITCANDLVYWYKNYNTYIASSFELTSNINMTAHYWTPIRVFNGKFNGNYYKISAVYIFRETADNSTPEEEKMSGLFSKLNSNAVVENLNIQGTIASGSTSNGTTAHIYRGGGLIAGINNGTIKNCYIDNGVPYLHTKLYGTSANKSTYFGGIVGINNTNGKIISCITSGSATLGPDELENVDHMYLGGIAGYSAGTIEKCMVRQSQMIWLKSTDYAIGTNAVLGGVVGRLYNGTISECAYNNKNAYFYINASYEFYSAIVGGIAGIAEGSSKIERSHCNAKEIKINEPTDSDGTQYQAQVSLKTLSGNSSFSNVVSKTYDKYNLANVYGDVSYYAIGYFTSKFDFTNAKYQTYLADRYVGGIVGKAFGTTKINNCFNETETFSVARSRTYYYNVDFKLVDKNGKVVHDDFIDDLTGSWSNEGSITAYAENGVTFTNCFAKVDVDPDFMTDLNSGSRIRLGRVYYSGGQWKKAETSPKDFEFYVREGDDGDSIAMCVEYYDYYTTKSDKVLGDISVNVMPANKIATYSTAVSNLTKNHGDIWVVKDGETTPSLRTFYWKYSTQEPSAK